MSAYSDDFQNHGSGTPSNNNEDQQPQQPFIRAKKNNCLVTQDYRAIIQYNYQRGLTYQECYDTMKENMSKTMGNQYVDIRMEDVKFWYKILEGPPDKLPLILKETKYSAPPKSSFKIMSWDRELSSTILEDWAGPSVPSQINQEARPPWLKLKNKFLMSRQKNQNTELPSPRQEYQKPGSPQEDQKTGLPKSKQESPMWLLKEHKTLATDLEEKLDGMMESLLNLLLESPNYTLQELSLLFDISKPMMEIIMGEYLELGFYDGMWEGRRSVEEHQLVKVKEEPVIPDYYQEEQIDIGDEFKTENIPCSKMVTTSSDRVINDPREPGTPKPTSGAIKHEDPNLFMEIVPAVELDNTDNDNDNNENMSTSLNQTSKRNRLLLSFRQSKRLVSQLKTKSPTSKSEDSEGSYRCKYCNRVYKYKYHANRHMNYHCPMRDFKEKRSFKCKECDQVFTSNWGLQRHTLFLHKKKQDKVVACKRCRRIFLNDKALDKHLDRQICRGGYAQNPSCDKCHRPYRYANSLRRHQKSECGKEPAFGCAHCNYRTHQKANIIRHLARKHSDIEMKVTCPRCPKVYKNECTLKRHLDFECGKEPAFACDLCTFKTKRKFCLTEHMKTQHSKKRRVE